MTSSPLLLALVAGLSIPLGAALSGWKGFREFCLHRELDSFVTYLGGGALLAALALVLVPEGMAKVPVLPAVMAFLAGGLAFWRFATRQKASEGSFAVFMGMLLDFIPESIALGAAAATGSGTAGLLMGLIFLQNMPQGFSAAATLRNHSGKGGGMRRWIAFLFAPLAGPAGAWLGFSFLGAHPLYLGLLMLFCSGGILFLLLDEIAPSAHLKNHHFPTLGSIFGFALGLAGTFLLHT